MANATTNGGGNAYHNIVLHIRTFHKVWVIFEVNKGIL